MTLAIYHDGMLLCQKCLQGSQEGEVCASAQSEQPADCGLLTGALPEFLWALQRVEAVDSEGRLMTPSPGCAL